VEVLNITPRIRELIHASAPASEIEAAARMEGMRTLRDVGVARVKAGETTLQELERVLGDVGRAASGEATPGSAGIPVSTANQAGPAAGAGPSAPAVTQEATSESARTAPAATPALAAVIEDEEDGAVPPILLVDDDSANRTIAKALLESEGHQTVEAADGVEAVELLQSGQHFSLVVLDLEMPRMNGDEVLKEIRGSLATVGLPVIVLTGTGDPDAELNLMEAGADDYIRKPFDPRRFMIRVKAALRRAGLVAV